MEDESLVLKLYYTARTDISYKVRYLEQGIEAELSPDKDVLNQTFNMQVTEDAIPITGYTLVSATPATLTLGVEGNVIIFYYTETEKYGIFYEWIGLDNVTIAEGYTAVKPANVEKAYYAGDPVVVDLNYQSGYSVIGSKDGKLYQFTFNGWESDSDEITPDPLTGDFTMPEEDVYFTGEWAAQEYFNVTYVWAEANGGNRPTDDEISAAVTSLGLSSALPGAFIQLEGLNVNVAYGTVYESYKYFERGDTIEGVYNGTQGTWTFIGWTSEDTLYPVLAAHTEFIMPGNDVTLKGTWVFGPTLLVNPLTKVYNGAASSISVVQNTILDGDTLYYRLSENDEWSTVMPTFVDVDETPVTVYVKAVNADSTIKPREDNAIVTITPVYITITAPGGYWTYNGSLRTVSAGPTFSASGIYQAVESGSRWIVPTNTAERVSASWPSNETAYSAAYGEGRGVANGRRYYPVVMGQDSSGIYPYSGVDANSTSVNARILKAGSDSTGNYVANLVNGEIEIYGSTSTTTTTTPTRTTTTTTPTTTVERAAVADPPAVQDIAEASVPLAAAPPASEVEIADEAVPLGPLTGDISPILLLICVLLISGGAIIIVSKKRFGKNS